MRVKLFFWQSLMVSIGLWLGLMVGSAVRLWLREHLAYSLEYGWLILVWGK